MVNSYTPCAHLSNSQENSKMKSPFSPISSHDQLLADQDIVLGAKLIELIGRGEVGRVYKALVDCGAYIAVKIVPFCYDGFLSVFDESTFEEMKSEAMNEARAHDTLDHQNIALVYSVYCCDHYIVMHMEYVDGQPLWLFLEEHAYSLDNRDGEEIINQLCSAIEYIHELDIAHGDLHMGNVLVDRNLEVKLIDFGSVVIGELSDEAKKRDLMHLKRIRNIVLSTLQNPEKLKNRSRKQCF